jgi:hypothetical protein
MSSESQAPTETITTPSIPVRRRLPPQSRERDTFSKENLTDSEPEYDFSPYDKGMRTDTANDDNMKARIENLRNRLQNQSPTKSREEALARLWPSPAFKRRSEPAFLPFNPASAQPYPMNQWGGLPAGGPAGPYGMIPNPNYVPEGYLPPLIPGVSRPVPEIVDMDSLRNAIITIKEDAQKQAEVSRIAAGNSKRLAAHGQRLQKVLAAAIERENPDKKGTKTSKSKKHSRNRKSRKNSGYSDSESDSDDELPLFRRGNPTAKKPFTSHHRPKQHFTPKRASEADLQRIFGRGRSQAVTDFNADDNAAAENPDEVNFASPNGDVSNNVDTPAPDNNDQIVTSDVVIESQPTASV